MSQPNVRKLRLTDILRLHQGKLPRLAGAEPTTVEVSFNVTGQQTRERSGVETVTHPGGLEPVINMTTAESGYIRYCIRGELKVPKNATILKAVFKLQANAGTAERKMNTKVWLEKAADAALPGTANKEVAGLTHLASEVLWKAALAKEVVETSPSLKVMFEELTKQAEWKNGNHFIIGLTAQSTEICAFQGSAGTPVPVVVVEYEGGEAEHEEKKLEPNTITATSSAAASLVATVREEASANATSSATALALTQARLLAQASSESSAMATILATAEMLAPATASSSSTAEVLALVRLSGSISASSSATGEVQGGAQAPPVHEGGIPTFASLVALVSTATLVALSDGASPKSLTDNATVTPLTSELVTLGLQDGAAILPLTDTAEPQIALGSSYRGLVLGTPGLLAYWRLDESAGTEAADIGGHAVAGTYHNVLPKSVAGPLADLDLAQEWPTPRNAANYVGIPNSPTLQVSGAVSIALWLWMAEEVEMMVFEESRAENSNTGYSILIENGLPKCRIKNRTEPYATAEPANEAKNKLSLKTWHLLIGTYDGTTIRIFVDGTEVASKAYTGLVETTTAGWIGRLAGLFGNVYAVAGKVDEVSVFNVAVSPARIAELYEGRSLTESSRPIGGGEWLQATSSLRDSSSETLPKDARTGTIPRSLSAGAQNVQAVSSVLPVGLEDGAQVVDESASAAPAALSDGTIPRMLEAQTKPVDDSDGATVSPEDTKARIPGG